jgi:hypothetical protein
MNHYCADIFIERMNTQPHKALVWSRVGLRVRGSPRREDVAELTGGGGERGL